MSRGDWRQAIFLDDVYQLGKLWEPTDAPLMPIVSDYSQRFDKLRDNCPVRAALDEVLGRWKPLILFELRTGTKRFTELRTALPDVTAQTLALQLRQLEADEIVTRTLFPEIPIRVEYQLGAYGQTLSERTVQETVDRLALDAQATIGSTPSAREMP